MKKIKNIDIKYHFILRCCSLEDDQGQGSLHFENSIDMMINLLVTKFLNFVDLVGLTHL